MSSLFVSGKQFEELEAMIHQLESKIETIERGFEFLEKENGTLRTHLEELAAENREIKKKLEASVLTSAKNDVLEKTDEMVEKARQAVNEYFKPVTK